MVNRAKRRWTFGLFPLAIVLSSVCGAQANSSRAVPKTMVVTATLFPVSAVRLLNGPFLRAALADRSYILALDPDRLLAPIRREAGLKPRKPSYENWENIGLDGHTMGHYLSALSYMIASGHDNDRHELRRRLDTMIDELGDCQKASGDGYIGGIPGSKAFWAKVSEGHIEAFNEKWVPWYNLHKTFAGLRDAYIVAGNRKARDILVRFGEWADHVTSKLTDDQMQRMLGYEHGGMNETLADIYAITRDRKFLDLAKRFDHLAILDPLERDEDRLTGLHANTQIPKVIGFERIAGLTNDAKMDEAAQFFWSTVTQNRSVAFGGNSVSEHFNDPKDCQRLLESREGPETCNTYNMLRLTEALFEAHPQAAYADYYERALYNHILASIDVEHPGFVYFTPLRPGHYRVYSQPSDCFWCCVGTGMENPGRYGRFIYAQAPDGIYVNLFIASELQASTQGISLRQETTFPEEGKTRITVHVKHPTTTTLFIRHPHWVETTGLKIRVNGVPESADSTPSSYCALRREWKNGDRIDIDLPMRPTIEGLPDHSSWYAMLYGPIVLASPVKQGDQPGLFAGAGRGDHIASGPLIPLDQLPMLVCDPQTLADHIVPDPSAGPLRFRLKDIPTTQSNLDIELQPFFQLQESRYQMYWEVTDQAGLKARQRRLEAEEQAKIEWDRATIDSVAIGEQQSEVDHQLVGEGTETGIFNDRRWRHGNWFQFTLGLRGFQTADLVVTYWGGDTGRTFDILVNGKLLASEANKGEHAGQFFEKRYVLSGEVIRSAHEGQLQVRFVGKGTLAGGIYDLRLMKSK